MAANDRWQHWRQELQELQHWRSRLSTAWDAGLAELRTTGRPPAPELADEQAVYAQRLTSLTTDIALDHPQAAQLGKPSLDALADLCEELAVAHEARAVLEEILSWEHVSEPDYEPLRLVQAQARRSLNELSRLPLPAESRESFRELAGGHHALCDLVRLRQSGEDMHDGEWTRLHDRVTEVFGRTLATSISRGRIHSQSASSPVVASDRSDDAPPEQEPASAPPSVIDAVAAPAEIATVDETPAEDPDFVYDFVSTGTRMTGVLEAAAESPPAVVHAPVPNDSALTDVKPDSGLLEAWSRLRKSRLQSREEHSPHEAPASALADAALQATGEERVRCLFRLIDQLLIDDEPALACHLMNTLEKSSPGRLTPLPASLIRAFLVSRHVCYPQGELHRSVEDDLRKQQPRRHQEAAQEERLAYGFLCRAASLLPAVLCSSSSAVRLLQSFPIEPGLIQVYNFASRIASYAERLQGKTAEMLQARQAGVPTSQELAALRESAVTWLSQMIKQTLPYARSSPLFLHAHWTVMAGTVQRCPEAAHIWSRWQETWLAAHRLLKPVLQGTASDRSWVKHEIDRLSAPLRKEPLRNGHPSGNEADAASSAMRDVLSQAVEYATGWLRLQVTDSASSNLPVREMEELRTEIRERSAAVLAELRPFASIQKPPTLRAATFCLQRAVQQIESLFTEQALLSWREPELRHLLHADLLKIPCLPLNDRWEPEVDPGELETELLELISRGVRTWQEAFQRQSQLRDHAATSRLLELPVWNSAAEHAELMRQRQDRVAACRAELQAELQELQADAQSLCESGPLSAADYATIERRLERLASAAPRTLDFQIAEIQLQQVRLMLQRRSSSSPADAGSPPPAINGNGVHPPKAVPVATRNADQVEEAVSPSEPANPWVMDILFEDR